MNLLFCRRAFPPRRLLAIAAFCGAGLVFGQSAFAQQASMFGNSGPLTGPTGFRTGTTGSASMGGNGLGSTAFLRAGAGGAQNQGANPLGQLGQQGMAGQPGAGFLGANNNAQGGLLGANRPGGQQGQFGQQGRNQRFGNQGNIRGANRGNNAAMQQQSFNNPPQAAANNQRVIRPQLKVAFSAPRPTSEKTVDVLSNRFDKLSKRLAIKGVEIEADGGKVTLRGQVNSEDDRKLAAMLVSLEPGVRSVQNELTVSPPPAPEPGE